MNAFAVIAFVLLVLKLLEVPTSEPITWMPIMVFMGLGWLGVLIKSAFGK